MQIFELSFVKCWTTSLSYTDGDGMVIGESMVLYKSEIPFVYAKSSK